MSVPEMEEILIVGHQDKSRTARFEGLSMRHDPEGETVLSGELDQAALHGVLIRIRGPGSKSFAARQFRATGS